MLVNLQPCGERSIAFQMIPDRFSSMEELIAHLAASVMRLLSLFFCSLSLSLSHGCLSFVDDIPLCGVQLCQRSSCQEQPDCDPQHAKRLRWGCVSTVKTDRMHCSASHGYKKKGGRGRQKMRVDV